MPGKKTSLLAHWQRAALNAQGEQNRGALSLQGRKGSVLAAEIHKGFFAGGKHTVAPADQI